MKIIKAQKIEKPKVDPMAETFKKFSEKIAEILSREVSPPVVNVNQPDIIMPEIKVPAIKIPTINVPEIKMPEIKMPQAQTWNKIKFTCDKNGDTWNITAERIE